MGGYRGELNAKINEICTVLFHVETVDTTNREYITFNGMFVQTVDMTIDVHVLFFS